MDAGVSSGKLVAEVKGISKTFTRAPFPLEVIGARTILKDFTTRIVRGDRIAIVGPNGAGKTTLVKLLLGELAPDDRHGEARHQPGDRLSRPKPRDDLKSEMTLWDALTPLRRRQHPRQGPLGARGGLCARISCSGTNQLRQPVSTLSGGERNRLLLARALAKPANLLVMDEPTNDLDMETLDLLEDLLAEYDGTLLLVSHDRDFVDRLASSTIALDGRGNAVETPGGWTDFMRQNPGFFDGALHHRRSRRRALLSPEAAAAKIATLPPPPPPSKPVKLTFKDQHRLTEAERQIADLPAEIAALEDRARRRRPSSPETPRRSTRP